MPHSTTKTNLDDLPDVLLSQIITLLTSPRTRNSVSLVSHKWLLLERSTRTTLSLRGNVRDLFLLPSCFRTITSLDLSLLSPWGHSLLPSSSTSSPLISQLIHRSFPSLHSLTLYSRTPSTLLNLAPLYPNLTHLKLIRWHQRCSASPVGDDFLPIFQYFLSLTSLDLSEFYCWTEDFPSAILSTPNATINLTSLNLLIQSLSEGFMSHQLLDITAACPNLTTFLAVCTFDPRYIDSVGEETLLGIATNCPRLSTLHLSDAASFPNLRGDPLDNAVTEQDAKITVAGLQSFFTQLPFIQELVLDVCHNVGNACVALEVLNAQCPRLRVLKLGQFHRICNAIGRELDGVALCKGLEFLSIKNAAGFDDDGLIAVAHGCQKLTKFHVHGCIDITEMGMETFTCVLRRTLIEVKISCCRNLEAAAALKAMLPIRKTIQMLHIDCLWHSPAILQKGFDLNELDEEEYDLDVDSEEEYLYLLPWKRSADYCEPSTSKKCKYSAGIDWVNCPKKESNGGGSYSEIGWDRLQSLSLWVQVGDVLGNLHSLGLENCPVLDEIQIKVEGDCRRGGRPSQDGFGLNCLMRYPQLSKMKLDLGDAIGNALTAPTGQMDLSLWERFYLSGIGNLNLNELDYWPPQDRDVNQRSLSLPAPGLLAECTTLRKLFIHGTAHEHFMRFLLNIPNLRECQLREDYYPAPEDDMSTEMRVASCSRFEDALNMRQIPD